MWYESQTYLVVQRSNGQWEESTVLKIDIGLDETLVW